MSEITTHERPGVYSSYDASSLTAAASGGGAVCIVANGGTHTGGPYTWVSYSRAVADVGVCTLSKLARLALKNGAGLVYGIPGGGDYTAAFEAAAAIADVAVVICDSTELTVQQALRDSVQAASEARRERIAVVCGGAEETVTELVARAQAINDQRVVLAAPCEAEGAAGSVAAAVAGAIAGSLDPAVPLGGARLRGVNGLKAQYTDSEIDLLVRGGVTPLESVAGAVTVVRGITTKTMSGGVQDGTWRELSTILIVDDVIPAIRNSLRAKFRRAKNTAQSRGAIRSQVILELENKLSAEIITGYDNVTVTAKEDDPTVCLVDFSFMVTHGINQIWLTAHITV